MSRCQPLDFKTRILSRESGPTPTIASCHGHTSSIVRPRNLDTLAKNLKEYQILIHIFHPALWNLRQGLPSAFKHHSYRIKTCLITHATYACMFNRARHNNVESDRHLGSQQLDPCIVMQSHVSR